MAVGKAGPKVEEVIKADPLVGRLAQELDGAIVGKDPVTTALVDVAEGKFLSVLAKGTEPATPQAEDIEQDPTLQRFKADYDKLPEDLKAKCPWAVGKERLLANGGKKLKLAQAMEQGGILFGVDKNGQLLFADKGDEPIMRGMTYKDTHDRVLFKHDRLDKEGKMELDENKRRIPTGYEMFGDEDDEIQQYESHTKGPFIVGLGYEERSSWVELGKNKLSGHVICFKPHNGFTDMYYHDPEEEDPTCGVRRLLRV